MVSNLKTSCFHRQESHGSRQCNLPDSFGVDHHTPIVDLLFQNLHLLASKNCLNMISCDENVQEFPPSVNLWYCLLFACLTWAVLTENLELYQTEPVDCGLCLPPPAISVVPCLDLPLESLVVLLNLGSVGCTDFGYLWSVLHYSEHLFSMCQPPFGALPAELVHLQFPRMNVHHQSWSWDQ